MNEDLAEEFAESTSLHGLKLIVDPKSRMWERVLAGIVFVGGIVFAVVLSHQLWAQWVAAPSLIAVGTTNVDINDYAFPTVSICSVNKISTRALAQFASNRGNAIFSTEDMRRFFEIMSTNIIDDDEELQRLDALMNQSNISSESYDDLMKMISPNCSDMIVYCSWNAKEEDCNSLFRAQYTSAGYCCFFNSIIFTPNKTADDELLAKDKKKRYDRNSGIYSMLDQKRKTLRQAETAGFSAGLNVILDSDVDDYNFTTSPFTGFKVSIVQSDDYQEPEAIGFPISPGWQANAAVIGELHSPAHGIRYRMSLRDRACAFPDEIDLKHFDSYSDTYCEIECFATHLLANCSCVPYYLPIDAPTCSIGMYRCVERVVAYLEGNESACYCPPTCTDLVYNSEISYGTYPNPVTEYPPSIFRRRKFRNLAHEEFDAYAQDNIVLLNVYFKMTSGVQYVTHQKTTWTDFIAATGGLLVLGFGFSILSICELFYFFALRHWNKERDADQKNNHESIAVKKY